MNSLARGKIGLLAVLLMVLTACGGRGELADDGQNSTINVQVKSFNVKASATTVRTGDITFAVTNKDVITHEMLAVRVGDLEPTNPSVKVAFVENKRQLEFIAQERLVSQLTKTAYDESISRLDEEKITSLGEVTDLEGQKSNSVTLNLPPGQYLLICNITSHFQSGMHVRLLVTP
jgi:uncharacterized cupredoxin-like copper-binding protein